LREKWGSVPVVMVTERFARGFNASLREMATLAGLVDAPANIALKLPADIGDYTAVHQRHLERADKGRVCASMVNPMLECVAPVETISRDVFHGRLLEQCSNEWSVIQPYVASLNRSAADGKQWIASDVWGIKRHAGRSYSLDFWALARARYFFGNYLSSLTAMVCLIRLGSGRACHNVPLAILLMDYGPSPMCELRRARCPRQGCKGGQGRLLPFATPRQLAESRMLAAHATVDDFAAVDDSGANAMAWACRLGSPDRSEAVQRIHMTGAKASTKWGNLSDWGHGYGCK
jgi:hypothetical protein